MYYNLIYRNNYYTMHYYLYTLYRYHNMYRQCACVPVVLYYFTVRYHRQYICMDM